VMASGSENWSGGGTLSEQLAKSMVLPTKTSDFFMIFI